MRITKRNTRLCRGLHSLSAQDHVAPVLPGIQDGEYFSLHSLAPVLLHISATRQILVDTTVQQQTTGSAPET
jgi:hypothetical protein